MAIPEGYEKLAVVGIAWKGDYAADTEYKTMNAIYHEGSTYVALRDNPTGPPTDDKTNWQYLAKGFVAALLSMVTAKDTSGLMGTEGAEVGAQDLIDKIAQKVATELVSNSALAQKLASYVAKVDIVQTESTRPDVVPSSAYLKQQLDTQNSNLDNHLCMFPNGLTAVQSQNGNTWRRLQIQTEDDDIAVYKSTDGGQTWPGVRVLVSNADIAPLNSQHVGHINYSIPDKVNIVLWDQNTIDTPFKTGQTVYGNGFCLTLTTGTQIANDQWMCQLAMAVGDSHLFTRHCRGGVWSGWTAIGSPAI